MNSPKTKTGYASGSSSQDRPQRLFFAFWPDDSLRQKIVRRSKSLVQATPGRSVPVENLHITLAFLGSVDVAQQVCVERMAEAISCSPFELTLDHFGHWTRSKVLWFAPNESPELLIQLADRLAAGARECGLSLDSHPYRPHLTLMRKVSSVPETPLVEPMTWLADRFALLRSVPVSMEGRQGVTYEVIREWRLNNES